MNNMLNNWINRFVKTWEKKDIETIKELFSRTDEYYETPFSVAVSTPEEIEKLWLDIIYQDEMILKVDIITEAGTNAALHWYLKYKDSRDMNTYEMDGVYQVVFDSEGYCRYFKQWWVMNE